MANPRGNWYLSQAEVCLSFLAAAAKTVFIQLISLLFFPSVSQDSAQPTNIDDGDYLINFTACASPPVINKINHNLVASSAFRLSWTIPAAFRTLAAIQRARVCWFWRLFWHIFHSPRVHTYTLTRARAAICLLLLFTFAISDKLKLLRFLFS